MAKPLHQFGGWLRFFQIANIISLIIGGLAFILVLYVYFEASSSNQYIPDVETAAIIFGVIKMPVFFYLTIKVLGHLKVKSPSSPEDVSRFIRYALIFAIVSSAVEVMVYSNYDNSSNQIFESVKLVIQSIISAAIWLSYFKKSVRVKKFYGKNAGERFSYTAEAERLSEAAE